MFFALNELRYFKGTNGKTYKGLFVGHFLNVYPIPYFEQNTINKYLSQFNKEDLNYHFENKILGVFCPKSQRYKLGGLELPKVDFEGKTYFCFALDMQFELIKIKE